MSNKGKRVTKRSLVLATTKPYTRHNLPEHTVAQYNCDCGFKGAVQGGLKSPHCSSCGSTVTAKVVASASAGKKAKPLSLKTCASTVSLLCDGCDTHNLMATATALDFDGKTHCVSCGQGLEYDVADVVDDAEDVNLENSTGSDDFKSSIVAGESEDDDTSPYDEDESLDDDDEDISTLSSADEDEDYGEDTSEDPDFIGGDGVEEADAEDEDLDDGNDSALDGDATETPVVAMLSKKVLATARLVSEDDAIHIFAGSHCVATVKRTVATAKVFGTASHLNLMNDSLGSKGVKATIANFNFDPVTISVPYDKKLKVAVASVQADSNSKLTAKLKAQASTLKQSLEIAALGFTRDAFSNESSNPLKDAVCAALKSLGADPITAAVKTQKIFADAGDDYAEVLLGKASEIASLSAVARNQLAQTFASMSVPTPDFALVQAVEDRDTAVASHDDLASSYFNQPQNDRLDSAMRPSATASMRPTNGGSNIDTSLFSRDTLHR